MFISASEYEFRISDDIDILTSNFSYADILDLKHVNMTPGIPGDQEALTLVIDASEAFTSTTFMAIRAKDESGNFGEVSNTVSILVAVEYKLTAQEYVPRPPQNETSTREPTTEIMTTEHVNDNTTSYSPTEELPSNDGRTWRILVIALPVVVFTLIVVLIGVFILRRRLYEKRGNVV